MKKLLSLLSVLTINGSAVPTTIAASPYQVEEINSEIIYSQKNNLEYLNRSKRANNNNNNNILRTKIININGSAREYFKDLFNNVLEELLNNNIIMSVSNSNSNTQVTFDRNYFVINTDSSYSYFIVPFNVENRGTIDLVFRVSDFYLQGFIYNKRFYHFSDSTITSISNNYSNNLGFDSNYNTLISSSNPTISWFGITQAFNDLINHGENHNYQSNNAIIRDALARVILATSESMRFRKVRNRILNIDNNYWTEFYQIITKWSRTTTNAINYLTQNGNLNNFDARNTILIFTTAMLTYLSSCNNIKKRSLNINEQSICVNVRQDLYNEIRNTALGTIINENNDTILNALSRNNPNLDMSKISIGDKGGGWSRIDANNYQDKYIPRTWKVVTWHILKPDHTKTTVHGASLSWRWNYGW